MQVLHHPGDCATGRACAVTIGAYDGVHIGHRLVIERVKRVAAEQDLASAVVTFDQHPAAVVRPESAPRLLTDLEQRLELLEDTGVDYVLVVRFDQTRAEESAEDFVREVLVGCLDTRAVVVGHDFHFGYQAARQRGLLQDMGAEFGFDVTGLRLFGAGPGGQPVSSTRIRELLAAGAVERGRRPARPAPPGSGRRDPGRPPGPGAGLPDRQRGPAGVDRRPGRRRLRRLVPAARRGPPAGRPVPRAPSHLLRGSRAVPARGLPPGFRRRPVRRAGPGRVRRPPARPGALRLGRRPHRPDGPGRGDHPARSWESPIRPEASRPARAPRLGVTGSTTVRRGRRLSRRPVRPEPPLRASGPPGGAWPPAAGAARPGWAGSRSGSGRPPAPGPAGPPAGPGRSARFRACDRSSLAATATTGPSRATSRSRAHAGKLGDAADVEAHLRPACSTC